MKYYGKYKLKRIRYNVYKADKKRIQKKIEESPESNSIYKTFSGLIDGKLVVEKRRKLHEWIHCLEK